MARLHRYHRWRRLALVAALAGAPFALPADAEKVRPRPIDLNPNEQGMTLDEIEARVSARHDVPEVLARSAAASIAKGEVVVFDVRTVAEFEAGHIPGAIRVDPDLSAEDYAAHFATLHHGRTAYFVCAVGERSSRMMRRVNDVLVETGAGPTYNLRGGMFRWHLEQRPIVANGAMTGDIHPYDEDWQRLLEAEKARR
jgi:rhodanese-related sulfurtransferase